MPRRKKSMSPAELADFLRQSLSAESLDGSPMLLISIKQPPDRELARLDFDGKYYGETPSKVQKLLQALMGLYPDKTIDVVLGSGALQLLSQTTKDSEDYSSQVDAFDQEYTFGWLRDVLTYGLKRESDLIIVRNTDASTQTQLTAEEIATKIISSEDGIVTLNWQGRDIRFLMWPAEAQITDQVLDSGEHVTKHELHRQKLLKALERVASQDRIVMSNCTRLTKYGDFINAFYATIAEWRRHKVNAGIIDRSFTEEQWESFIESNTRYLLEEISPLIERLHTLGPIFYYGETPQFLEHAIDFLYQRGVTSDGPGASADATVSRSMRGKWVNYSLAFKKSLRKKASPSSESQQVASRPVAVPASRSGGAGTCDDDIAASSSTRILSISPTGSDGGGGGGGLMADTSRDHTDHASGSAGSTIGSDDVATEETAGTILRKADSHHELVSEQGQDTEGGVAKQQRTRRRSTIPGSPPTEIAMLSKIFFEAAANPDIGPMQLYEIYTATSAQLSITAAGVSFEHMDKSEQVQGVIRLVETSLGFLTGHMRTRLSLLKRMGEKSPEKYSDYVRQATEVEASLIR